VKMTSAGLTSPPYVHTWNTSLKQSDSQHDRGHCDNREL
jgi:hypothetical protein